MDEALVGELEAAIADIGALVVRVQKYVRGAGPEGTELLREALVLGDAARRLHRHGALDADAARALLAEAGALGAGLAALVAAVRAAPEYGAAVAAHAAGDGTTLARLLPGIFAGLASVRAPGALYHPLPWRRRGRLRSVDQLVDDARRARDDGLIAEGDDLSPGADAALPAVVLLDTPPGDEPVALRFAGAALPPSLLRLTDTGEYLVPTARLRVPFAVRLAADLTEADEDDATAAAVDWPRYRADLTAALEAAGLHVVDDEPA
jgi:hypothetical protein